MLTAKAIFWLASTSVGRTILFLLYGNLAVQLIMYAALGNASPVANAGIAAVLSSADFAGMIRRDMNRRKAAQAAPYASLLQQIQAGAPTAPPRA